MPDIILGGFSTDVTPPEVTAWAPTGTGVARNANVIFDIWDEETGVDTDSLNVTVGGIDAIIDGVIQLADFTGSITDIGSGTWRVTLNPNVDFPNYDAVEVKVNAQDLAPSPNIMDEFAWSFETEDDVAPDIYNNAPTGTDVSVGVYIECWIVDDGSGVDLVNTVITVNGDTVYDWDGAGVPNDGFQLGWENDSYITPVSSPPATFPGFIFIIKKNVLLDAWTDYETIVNTQDLAGNPAIFDWTFKTEDLAAPYLSELNPADGDRDVQITAPIQLRIDDDGSGVDESSVLIQIDRGSGWETAFDGSTIPKFRPGFQTSSTQTPVGNGWRFAIVPDINLPLLQDVTVWAQAADNATTPNWMDSTYAFTTLTKPTITAQNPAPDETGVSPGSNIYFELDDDSSGVDQSTIQCDVSGVSIILNGSFVSGYSGSITPDGTGRGFDVSITGIPPSYKYGVANSIRVQAEDFAGSPALDTTWSFYISRPFPNEWSVLYGPTALVSKNVTHASLVTDVLVNHSTHCRKFSLAPGGTSADFECLTYVGVPFVPTNGHSVRMFFRRGTLGANYPQLTLLARFSSSTDCYAVTYRTDMGGGDLVRLGRGVTANYDLAAEAVSGVSASVGLEWYALNLTVSTVGLDTHIQVFTATGSAACDLLDPSGEPTWVKVIDCFHRDGTVTPEIVGGFGTVIGDWGSIFPVTTGAVDWAICPGSTPDSADWIVVDTTRLFQGA